MGDNQEVLSEAQVRELRRTAASRRVPGYLSHRASIILDEHEARTSGRPRSSGVSRRTSRRWFERYERAGLAGIEDAQRSGRPSSIDRETSTAILVAPLYADSMRWTSRSIAAATGTTQSAVARLWKQVYEAGVTRLGEGLPSEGLRLEACGSDEDGSVLILRHSGNKGDTSPRREFMRSPLRPALQTVLAADIPATAVPRTEEVSRAASGALAALDASLSRRRRPAVAICSSAAIAEHALSLDPECSTVVVPRDEWQGLLLDLGRRLDPSSLETLTGAQQAAMRWAAYPDTGFVWSMPVADLGAPSAHRAPVRSLATTDLVAEAIVLALVDDISSGRLGGGDRITETHLSRTTHASRGQVRDAMKVLASRGIIDLEPNRGAVVPRPSVEDVVETYAARRALGALLVRRAAESAQPEQAQRLEAALAVMLKTATTGDALATGDDDFKLQEAIAEISGMRRVPAMFASLTAQLRLFVAVLRIRYGYSISAMCHDDIELVELILRGDANGAVGRWNQKMNDAAHYMLEQLELRDRKPTVSR